MQKAVGKPVSAPIPQTFSVSNRSLARAIAAQGAQAASVTKSAALHLFAKSHSNRLLADDGGLILCDDGSALISDDPDDSAFSASVRKNVGIGIFAPPYITTEDGQILTTEAGVPLHLEGGGQAAVALVNVGLIRTALIASSLTVRRSTSKIISAAIAQSATFTKAAAHRISAATAQLASIRKNIGKPISVANPQAMMLSKMVPILISMGQAQALTLRRTIGKTITAASALIAILGTKQIGRMILAPLAQIVTVSRAIRRTFMSRSRREASNAQASLEANNSQASLEAQVDQTNDQP